MTVRGAGFNAAVVAVDGFVAVDRGVPEAVGLLLGREECARRRAHWTSVGRVFYIDARMAPPGDAGASVASPDTAVTESMGNLKHEIKSSLRSSVAAAESHDSPYRHWFLKDVFPEGVYQTLKSMPFPVADLHGLSGTREAHNADRVYFSGENLEVFIRAERRPKPSKTRVSCGSSMTRSAAGWPELSCASNTRRTLRGFG